MAVDRIVFCQLTQQFHWATESCQVDFLVRPEVEPEYSQSEHWHRQSQSQQRRPLDPARHSRLRVEVEELRCFW